MRDINRIDRIIPILKELWLQYPELRLGQVLDCLLDSDQDLYYLEDTIIEYRIREILEENKQERTQDEFTLNEALKHIQKLYGEYEYLMRDGENNLGNVEFEKRSKALLMAEQCIKEKLGETQADADGQLHFNI